MYLDDGKVKTIVTSVSDGVVHVRAENDGILVKRKGMNLPDTDFGGDIITVNTTTIVPRFGVTYDLEGNGRTVVQASYGHYAGKYSDAQFAANTDVGTPSVLTYGSTCPAGHGRDFRPGPFGRSGILPTFKRSSPPPAVFRTSVSGPFRFQ